MRDNMQAPDQVGVRWHIGVQPAEPSLYWILDFAFLLAVLYRFAFFSRPLIRLGGFLAREGDFANDRTEPRFHPGNSLATVEWWWEPRY